MFAFTPPPALAPARSRGSSIRVGEGRGGVSGSVAGGGVCVYVCDYAYVVDEDDATVLGVGVGVLVAFLVPVVVASFDVCVGGSIGIATIRGTRARITVLVGVLTLPFVLTITITATLLFILLVVVVVVIVIIVLSWLVISRDPALDAGVDLDLLSRDGARLLLPLGVSSYSI